MNSNRDEALSINATSSSPIKERPPYIGVVFLFVMVFHTERWINPGKDLNATH